MKLFAREVVKSFRNIELRAPFAVVRTVTLKVLFGENSVFLYVRWRHNGKEHKQALEVTSREVSVYRKPLPVDIAYSLAECFELEVRTSSRGIISWGSHG